LEFGPPHRGFEKIREIAWEPWPPEMPRRYCVASVRLSDGTSHRLDYAIIEDDGWIGADYGVEWCVVGLDRKRGLQSVLPGCAAVTWRCGPARPILPQ
jgi:hypothetical protein